MPMLRRALLALLATLLAPGAYAQVCVDSNVTLRSVKGSSLSWNEMDANFTEVINVCSSLSGLDSKIVTGTPGANGTCATWNADGDLVSITCPVDTDTNTNAATICSGTLTYLDGDGGCDTYTLSGNTTKLGTVSGSPGAGICLEADASGNIVEAASGLACGSGGGGGSQNLFETINAPSGTDPVADSTTDTLNLVATSPITIVGDASTDTVTWDCPTCSVSGHAHTGSTLSGIDISDDTNLAVTSPIVRTDDTLSLTQNAGTDVTADLEEEGVTCTDCISLGDLDDDADTPVAGEVLTVATGDNSVEYVAQSAIAAGTAAALAANGANCSAGNYPLGVDASGAAESCTADDDVPEAGDFGALALTGDVTSSGLATTIGADKVLESHLKAVNGPTDELCLTYEATGGDFEWQSCGGGGSAFSDITSGTNTSAAMVVGSGSSLKKTSTGTIDASAIDQDGDGTREVSANGSTVTWDMDDNGTADLTASLPTAGYAMINSANGLRLGVGAVGGDVLDLGGLAGSTWTSWFYMRNASPYGFRAAATGGIELSRTAASSTDAAYRFNNDTDSGMGSTGSNDIRLIAGGVSGLGQTTTETTMYVEQVNSPSAQTCTDSGDGNPGALTVTVSGVTYVAITNSDADGCALTLSETGATNGQRLELQLVSSAGGSVTVADSAGVQELPADATLTLPAVGGGAIFRYAATYWSYSGPADDDTAETDAKVSDDLTHSTGSIALEALTLTSILDDEVLLGSGAGTGAFAAIPDCTDAGGGSLNYTAATNTFSCGTDAGAGGGMTSFDIRGDDGGTASVVTDAEVIDFLGGLGLVTDDNDNGADADLTISFDYSKTLAGNPALGAEECIWTTDGSGGGGLLCEGSVADGFEGLFLLPDVTGADDTQTLVTDATALGGDLTGTVGAASLGDDVVASAEMADADHGQVAWSGGVATVEGLQYGTAFPGSPATGDVFAVTDDSAAGACDSAAGSALTLCRWNGSAWAALGDGGGGGTPGGSDTQIQYNNAGAFGGIAGSVWNGSLLTLPQFSTSSLASFAGGIKFGLSTGTVGYIFNSGADLILSETTSGSGRWAVTNAAATGQRGHFWPVNDATRDLGGSSNRVRDGYFSGTVAMGISQVTDIGKITPKVTAPAACTIGDLYVDTSGAYCACSATNTWENMIATGSCV